MFRVTFMIILGLLITPYGWVAAESYSTVKSKIYEHIFEDQRETLYCRCAFDRTRTLVAGHCAYSAGRRNNSSHQIQIEHIVPASRLGKGRSCWQDRPCVAASGKRLSGRSCCRSSDPEFRRAYSDMHNLWPVIGRINQRRAHYDFGPIAGEEREFGRCDMEVRSDLRIAEPPADRQGEIARAYLHMEAQGYITLSPYEADQFRRWDQGDAPDRIERLRHTRIFELTGIPNIFILRHGPLASRNLPASGPIPN